MALARRGVAHLRRAVAEAPAGLRFPAASAAQPGGQPEYRDDLYDGSAGVALTLVDFARATGHAPSLALACRAAADLRASVGGVASLGEPGLYDGLGGLALLHLRLARVRGDARHLEDATRVADAMLAADLADADLLRGAAGVGIVLLAMHHATGEPRFAAGVDGCVDLLRARAERDAGGACWAQGAGDDAAPVERYTGLAHGTAGIALFLLHAARAPIPTARAAEPLLRDALRWLDARAVRDGGSVRWPRSAATAASQRHWCHGGVGIAELYLALHRRQAAPRALDVAVGAGTDAWRRLRARDGAWSADGPGHCHGLAGALELFVALEAATGDLVWADRAAALVRRLRDLAGPGRGPSDLGAEGCGAARGTAGVVRALLRAAGREAPAPHEVEERPVVTAGIAPAAHPRARSRFRSRVPAAPFVAPRVVGRLAGTRAYAAIDGEWEAARAAFARDFLRGPRAGPVHVAGRALDAATRALVRAHGHALAPGAVGWHTHGRLLRELVGVSLAVAPDALPAVARIARRRAAHHVGALAACLARVATDRAGALAGLVGGRLLAAEPLASDPHGGAFAVALRFEDGPELVYKPRDVRVDRFVAGAADGASTAATLVNVHLSARAAWGLVPTHRIVPVGGTHGYAERVATRAEPLTLLAEEAFADAGLGRPAPRVGARLAPEEARRFWYAAGALAGHAAAFGISDLHVENVVCGRSASAPALALHAVDLEVALPHAVGLAGCGLVPARAAGPAPAPGAYGGGDGDWQGLRVHPPGAGVGGGEPWGLEVVADGTLRASDAPVAIVARGAAHVVQNPDGSFGHSAYRSVVLRGLADHWEVVGEHRHALAAAARAALAAATVRVLPRTTTAYAAALARRHVGWRFRLAGPDVELGSAALAAAERAQLDALDVPYFYRRLGEPAVRWRDPATGAERVAASRDAPTLAEPVWDGPARHASVEGLAHCLADLAAHGAPPCAFDDRDDALGVRVVREVGEGPLKIAVVTRHGPVICVADPDGRLRWWRR